MALFGCIADDFTGASDMASFLEQGGLKTILYNGIPSENSAFGEALVVALKTRTAETEPAVEQSLQALRWLQKQGVRQVYIKYCSTFDSTPQGNIGPICDAVMEAMGVPYSLLCPALPVNGRTVKDGNLLVHGVPLHKSSMKDHPLTPMWDCDLKTLMEAQSRYCVYKIGDLKKNQRNWQDLLRQKQEAGKPFYLVPDCVSEEDAQEIVQSFGRLPLLTGGSGLAVYLARIFRENLPCKQDTPGGVSTPALLLAGSCSVATRGQVRRFLESGGIGARLDPLKLLSGEQTLPELYRMIDRTFPEPLLFYSSDEPKNLEKIHETMGDRASAMLEDVMARLAAYSVEQGAGRVIVAGGETSGAVTRYLGFDSFQIGRSIAPGVPMMIPVDAPHLRLVLKSGNFGDEDFFQQALTITGALNKEEIL